MRASLIAGSHVWGSRVISQADDCEISDGTRSFIQVVTGSIYKQALLQSRRHPRVMHDAKPPR
jgi:hypothetical protein